MKKYYFLCFSLFCLGIGATRAQYTVLHNFNDTLGGDPYGSLTILGNKLYGTSTNGGTYGDGIIFSIYSNGTAYRDMFDFNDTIGANPHSSLTRYGSSFYGMTFTGGVHHEGTIFSIDTAGTRCYDLFDFDGTSGAEAYGSLTLSDNVLYGMTSNGGSGAGDIFSFDPIDTIWTSMVYNRYYQGQYPKGSLTISSGVMYGMASGGAANGMGCLFSLDTNDDDLNYADLLDFNGTNGSTPGGNLTLSGNKLYGMVSLGGAYNLGCIFSIDTNGNGYKDLFDFDGTTGSGPEGSLTLSGNTLYGMTYEGEANNEGLIFSIDTNGIGYADLLDFNGTNGANPYGELTLSGNVFYGMTAGGGTNADGVIFRFTLLSATTNIINNLTCNGGTNGSATVTASGGFSPYTYSWSPNGGTDSIATGLSTGTYIVTVTDSTGLMGSAVVTITQPATIIVSGIIINAPHCNGDSTGSAYIIASGGTPPLSYVWNWGVGGFHYASTDTLLGLSAGTYTIIVNDSNGCDAKDSVIITQPAAIVGTTSIINPVNKCSNSNSGIISVLVTGGIAPYTYQWSDANSQTTDTAIGLSLGNYTVTITDNTGCSSFASNTFTLPNTAGDSISVITDVSCYGGSNGSATVIIGNGSNVVRNYLFEPAVQHFAVPTGINNITINIGGARGGDSLGGNGASFIGICSVIPGDVLSIAVGQEGGGNLGGGGGGASWVYDSSIVLYNPIGTLGLIAVAAGGGGGGYNHPYSDTQSYFSGGTGGSNLVTNAPVNNNDNVIGGTDGSGGRNSNGGTGWLSNGANDGRDSGGMDEANHFIVAVSFRGGIGGFGGGGAEDYGCAGPGCSGYGGGGGGYNGGGGGAFVFGGDPLGGGGGGSYFINTSPIVKANDTGNGFVTISYTVGGIPPYTYLWSNGETTATATGLSAGTYSVSVSDSSGCLFTDSVTITQPNAIIPTITEYSGVKCNGDSDAAIFANATGGSGFYEYQWSDASSQTNAVATGLETGTYSVTVTDNNGCTGTSSILISQPPVLHLTADSINATSGNCNGSAWAIVSGGTNPYSYLWAGGLTTDTIINQCTNYYCCTITDVNGCVDSVCVNIDVSTGTNQLIINNVQLTIYPNPNNGEFIVSCHSERSEESPSIIEIYNVLGEKVLSETLQPQTPKGALNSINLSRQPSGVYLYRVNSKSGILIGQGKVIIQQ